MSLSSPHGLRMSSEDESVNEQLLSEPLESIDDEKRAPHTIHAFHLEQNTMDYEATARNNELRQWKMMAYGFLIAFGIALCYTGQQVYNKHYGAPDPESAIHLSDGNAVSRLGNFSSRCERPWEYACGSYNRQSLRSKSVFGDAQAQVDAELSTILRAADESKQSRKFYLSCIDAENSVEYERPDAFWWWDRGLEAAGLTFGRVRSNSSRYRHLAVQVTDSDSHESAGCLMVPVSVCDGKLYEIVTRVGTSASFDDQMCILGGTAETACELVKVATQGNDTASAGSSLFQNTPAACIAETKRLWPYETSKLWESFKSSDEDDKNTLRIFEKAKAAIVGRLEDQKQLSLKAAVDNVKLNQRYRGPPEVYHSGLNGSDIFGWWEQLLAEQEEFDRSRLYFNEADWDMASHTINAYYWPYANAVFVTPAVSRWMLEGSEAERVGRLGFLLGHELGHAIHSNVNVLDDPAARAAYKSGKMCLTEEFGGSDLTTHEDMADRVGYGVVGALAADLEFRLATYCARDTCFEANEKHLAFLASAQPFCATESALNAADPLDTHSSNSERVRHSLKSTRAAASAWGCPVPLASTLCPVVGAPTQY